MQLAIVLNDLFFIICKHHFAYYIYKSFGFLVLDCFMRAMD